MKVSRRRFITIAACLAAGASTGTASAKPSTWHGVALGAEANLKLVGLSESEGRRLIRIAIDEINRLEDIFSLFRPDSVIARLNGEGFVSSPPPELLALLSLAASLHDETAQYFDPTVQSIWKAYADHVGNPPSSVVEAAKSATGMRHLQFDTGLVRFNKPHMALTLNGIAQGFITDRVVALLKSEGLQNAVVNVGEIAVLGEDDLKRQWQVGIAEIGDQKAEEYLSLSNNCIATSAAGATTFDGSASHIINPITGRPAQSAWRRVSVIHKSAAIADGLSTAFILMDEAQIRHVVERRAGIQLVAKSNDDRVIRVSN